MSLVLASAHPEAAHRRLLDGWERLLVALQAGPLLPAITLGLLLIALIVLVSSGGLAERPVGRPPSLPSDGPPPRMAALLPPFSAEAS